LYLLDRFKEYYTYSQAAQLVTIFPYMNVGAKSKGEIDNITLKPLHNGTILGVGALSIKPSQNSSATVELYLTYAGPHQNYNMFPHVGGTPFLKKAILSDRQRLFEKTNCSEHDTYLKTLHFKDMYLNLNRTNPVACDQDSAMSSHRTPLLNPQVNPFGILPPRDPTFIARLAERCNGLERNNAQLQDTNIELKGKLGKVTTDNEILISENRGLKTHIGDIISSTGTQREESARTITHLQQELQSVNLENPYRGVSDATS
jgi:hypothetical protein